MQTTPLAPSGAAIVEFRADYPGHCMLVDDALSRVDKGLIGALEVDGSADPALYRKGSANWHGMHE